MRKYGGLNNKEKKVVKPALLDEYKFKSKELEFIRIKINKK